LPRTRAELDSGSVSPGRHWLRWKAWSVSVERRRDVPTRTSRGITKQRGWQHLLGSQPITQENLDVVLDTGWIKKDELCQDVKPAIAPPPAGRSSADAAP
jgi:hypothetical protein